MPSLARIASEQDEEGQRFRIGMNLGVALYAAAFFGMVA
jgi:hypothetical protein